MSVRFHSTLLASPLRAALAAALLLSPATGILRADGAPVWKDVTPSGLADPNTQLGGVDYGNGTFVANAYFSDPMAGVRHNVTFTSADGTTWKQHTLDFGALGRVRFAKGKFFLFGAAPNKHIYSSTDGVSWSSVDDPETSSAATGIAEGNGVAVAARTSLSGIQADVTSDGVNWSASPLPNSSSFTASTDITFGAGKFAFVSAGVQGPFYFTSPDGHAWTAQPGLDYRNGFSFIAYGNGTFLAQENGASQHVSADGVTWAVASPGYRHDLPGIGTIGMALRFGRFLNGQFVGLTNNNTLAASADAQNWTDLGILPAGATSLDDVAFGGGHYAAIDGKHIYTDAAGSTPKTKTADLSVDFSEVKAVLNADGSKTKFKGKLTIANTGKRPAANVQVGAYLSDDKAFSAANDHFVSLVSLSDLGFPTLAKKSSSGALAVKFIAKTSELGATSGKFLLIVADPQNAIEEGDETNNVFVYGPLP